MLFSSGAGRYSQTGGKDRQHGTVGGGTYYYSYLFIFIIIHCIIVCVLEQ